MSSAQAYESPPFNLTEVDRQILSQTDDEFTYHDWDDLTEIIARNKLEVLRRKPSDLIRYIAWSNRIKAEYGSIPNYICQKRLRWYEPKDNDVADSNQQFRSRIPPHLPIQQTLRFSVMTGHMG